MSIETIGALSGATGAPGTSAVGYGQRLEDMDSAQMTRGLSDTMSVPGVGTSAITAARAASAAGAVSGAEAGSGGDFAALLSGGLDRLQAMQSTSDDLAVRAATGDLADVHDYMIASNEAQLATQLTVAVRNKAVDAFNEIMRMQL